MKLVPGARPWVEERGFGDEKDWEEMGQPAAGRAALGGVAAHRGAGPRARRGGARRFRFPCIVCHTGLPFSKLFRFLRAHFRALPSIP